MLPGNPNGMIFLKVVTEDGATKTIRCEPSTTIAEIKEQFSYRFDPNEHRICFADGRVGEENTPISQYGVEQNAFIYLRNKNLTQRRGSVGPRPAWADTGAPSSVVGDKPVLDMEPGETEKGHMSKLRQFISHFLKRRPTPQQLVDAKILNEAPVAPATTQPNYDDIHRCVEWLRKYAMHMEGVFRVSGSAQDNTTFAEKLLNHKLDIEQFTADQLSPHAVTTGLKIYMREKTSPVIPYKYYKEYMDNYRKGDKSAESVKQNCQHLICSLPENNRRILVMLCQFLKELAQFESENKMNPHNLGVVFGPTLMRTESTGLESLTECDSQIAVVEELIVHINEVDLTAIVSPDSVPSACGSGAAQKPAGAAKPGLTSPKSPSGVLVPPPMLTIPKNGSRVLRSTAGTTASTPDGKKPVTPTSPPALLSTPGNKLSSSASSLPAATPTSPVQATPAQPAAAPTTQPAPAQPASSQSVPPNQPAPAPQASVPPSSPKPNIVKAANSPPSNPPMATLPPGSRPPPGVAPTPGKPPMGHAPVPGSSPAPQPTATKLKLVPKFKINVRGAASAPVQNATSMDDNAQNGLQQEIIAALMSSNDLQKTKVVASQVSNMFETNPQEASNIVAADPATAAGLILLLGRSIAVSSN